MRMSGYTTTDYVLEVSVFVDWWGRLRLASWALLGHIIIIMHHASWYFNHRCGCCNCYLFSCCIDAGCCQVAGTAHRLCGWIFQWLSIFCHLACWTLVFVLFSGVFSSAFSLWASGNYCCQRSKHHYDNLRPLQWRWVCVSVFVLQRCAYQSVFEITLHLLFLLVYVIVDGQKLFLWTDIRKLPMNVDVEAIFGQHPCMYILLHVWCIRTYMHENEGSWGEFENAYLLTCNLFQ